MTSQKGSAHVTIIIGLVIALVGALGFVYWQNFIYKEPAVTKSNHVVVDNPGTGNETQPNLHEGYTLLEDWSVRFPSGSMKYELEKGSDSVSEYYMVRNEDVKKACGRTEASVASIIRYESDVRISEGIHEGMTAREAFANSSAKVVISKYTYVFAGPQSVCSDDDEANEVLSKNVIQLGAQFKKLEEF
jgi:hypothetical protein